MENSQTPAVEVHPLRAAVTAAQAALDATDPAHMDMYADDSIASGDPTYVALCEVRDAAITALDAAHDALVGSDCPREWNLCEEGYNYDTFTGTCEEAIRQASNNVDRGNYNEGEDGESTMWIDISVHCDETDEHETHTVQLDPEAPDCAGDETHDWQSPHEILGGLEENPGVWGHGGGVLIHEVCMHCGCKKTTNTWAQRMDTGEQGLTSVSYEPGAYDLSDLKSA